MRATFLPLAVFLSLAVFIASCSSAYAYEDIGYAQIHPAHPLYFLKSVRENLEVKLAQTNRTKVLRQLEFANRRLREFRSLLSTNKQFLIEPALEKYWFHISNVPIPSKDIGLETEVTAALVNHLEVLRSNFDQVSDDRAKRGVRHAVYRLTKHTDLPDYAKLDGCQFLGKEASSSALTEVERAILKERADSCLESLKLPI